MRTADRTSVVQTCGTVHDSIAKINATITVTPYSVNYDGTAHTATGTATGVGGANVGTLTLTGTTHTNAGTYNGDAWTFAGGANYNDANGRSDERRADLRYCQRQHRQDQRHYHGDALQRDL